MIWSIIPEEVIFEDHNLKQALKKVRYLDREVLISAEDDGRGRIVSLLSTNPQDYLDDRFCPGSLINDYLE